MKNTQFYKTEPNEREPETNTDTGELKKEHGETRTQRLDNRQTVFALALDRYGIT